ncbi:MAG: trypsin-like peptidase domain-containing protein [Candidatus Fonsibacter sp.]
MATTQSPTLALSESPKDTVFKISFVVILITAKDILKAVSFGDSDKARVGDWVVAIGNPFGLGGTVTAGIISARNRDISLGRYDDFIQTDAAINVGNSGGPLFNLKGEVVGINSAILSNSGGSVGIGFAIPSNLAKNVIDQIINTGEIKRGYIGVRIQEVTKEIADSLGLKNVEGALISSAATDGPANKAGILAGDVILEFNNIKVENYRRLQKIVADTPIGKNVDVKIWRNKQIITRNIKVARLEETVESRRENNRQVTSTSVTIKELGIKIRNINKEDVEKKPALKDKKGVLILEISVDSPLALLSVQVGEVITAVGNNPVFDIKNFEDQLKKEIRKNTNSILLTIFDINNQSKFIGVKIK